jgi:hypothetical protein
MFWNRKVRQMPKPSGTVDVIRHEQSVAVVCESRPCFFLDAQMARELAKALTAAADNIDALPHDDAHFRSYRIECSE